jgi:tetratricopeptide (TPR) repeat protein
VHLHRGELGEAMAAAQQALDIARRTGDRAREGEATGLCGAVLAELGRYEEARGWLARALALHEQTGARLSRAETLVAAGRLATLSGDPAAGTVSLEEAVAVAAETGARPPLARAKLELALALCRRRDPVLAGRHAAEATSLARAARLVGCEILGLSRQALALLESADARAALTSSTQALRLLDRTGATEGPEEELWFTHHRVLRALGDPSAASAVDHAHAVYRNKLARLRSSEWRQAFDATELHQQIRAAMS